MADYNINAVTRRAVFSGSAGTGPYAFTFEILSQTDLAVYFNAQVLTLTTDYTVTINANGTGSVTIVTGTNVPTTPDADDQIVIVGGRDIERTTDFVTAGDLRAASLNEQLDSQIIMIQQISEESSRGMRAPVYDPALVADGGVVDMTLPAKASRAGKTLAFDSNGNPTVGEDIGNWRGDWAASTAYTVRDLVKDASNYNVYRCNTAHTSSGSTPISSNADSAKWDLVFDASYAATQATNAAASATAAAASATAAAASESSASTDAATATTKASEASTSAASASTSAATATTKAAEASTSASNASTSETNAASSASSASTSAATATTQAGIATTKAGEASTSAANASTSETNAASSASSASTSASNASTSASAAASSASSAASAQSAAESARDSALAAYDNFDDRYLGVKSSDPTVDNDGDALVAGSLYFNSVSESMKIYTGSAWVAAYVSGTDFLALTGGTMTGDVSFGDNNKAIFGAGSDLQIYHSGADSYIKDTGTGDLNIMAADNLRLMDINSENWLYAAQNAEVRLYYDAAEKFRTTSTGVDVTGTVTADGVSLGDSEYIYLGASNDLQIFHNGSNSYVQDSGAGNLHIRGSNVVYIQSGDGQENYAVFNDNGSSNLYYDNSVKISTTSYGIDISGSAVADTHTSNVSGTSTADFASYQNFVWTLTNNITLGNPSNEKVGQSGFFIFIQDGVGSRTISLGTDYETAGGAGITLSTAPNAVDVVPYIVKASGSIQLGTPQLAFA